MAQEDYDNIELTQEEMDGLNDIIISPETTKTGIDESTDSQATDKVENAVQSAEETTTEEPSTEVNEPVVVDGFEIDGERYDREAIMAWREDSDNKESWQKSNTEKAQNLSKWSKLSEKINGDDSFREHIKDFFFDDPEAVKSTVVFSRPSVMLKMPCCFLRTSAGSAPASSLRNPTAATPSLADNTSVLLGMPSTKKIP